MQRTTSEIARTSARAGRLTTILLGTCIAVAAGILTPTAAQAQEPGNAVNSRIDDYLFARSITEFAKARRGHTAGDGLDWSSDGCSVPKWARPALGSKDRPGVGLPGMGRMTFDFLAACHRHDFGYRNYKDQNRFTESAKKRIDRNFKDDMYGVCRKYKGLRSGFGVECRRIADAYFTAVSRYGK